MKPTLRGFDLVGQRYGRLIVLELAEPIKDDKAWKCQCECGTIKVVKQENLRNGDTKSCGCWNKEQAGRNMLLAVAKITKYTPVEASARRVWKSSYGDNEMLFEDFFTMSQLPCFYCGVLPSNRFNVATSPNYSQKARKEGLFIYNGLDRVNNDLPHTKENCVPCCKRCNFAKRARTLDDFIAWIRALVGRINRF